MAPSAAMPSSSPAGPGSGSTFDDPSLAQFIAQKAGTGLAGKAPRGNVPLSQVKALSEQEPAGASIDTRTDTITFYTTTVSVTVVAIAPGKPDMTFYHRGAHRSRDHRPRRAAQVTAVQFINNDTDEAHGWLITGSGPPFGFGQLYGHCARDRRGIRLLSSATPPPQATARTPLPLHGRARCGKLRLHLSHARPRPDGHATACSPSG